MNIKDRELKKTKDREAEEKRKERFSAAYDEHKKLAKEGGAIVGPRQVANHRMVTKKVANGRTRMISRLRASMGFSNCKPKKPVKKSEG